MLPNLDCLSTSIDQFHIRGRGHRVSLTCQLCQACRTCIIAVMKRWQGQTFICFAFNSLAHRLYRNSPWRQSVAPPRPCGWATSRPMRDGDDEEEGDEDEDPDGDEGGRHWELWLGTADWELCDGIWAELELLLLCMLPIPFSVRNSSKSMYWSWKSPPSAGKVRSHMRGPRNWL